MTVLLQPLRLSQSATHLKSQRLHVQTTSNAVRFVRSAILAPANRQANITMLACPPLGPQLNFQLSLGCRKLVTILSLYQSALRNYSVKTNRQYAKSAAASNVRLIEMPDPQQSVRGQLRKSVNLNADRYAS
ncbi:hypothetical protein IVB45_18070 [Bradyrhizobium sp. 4]|uniref:hypothetical protein n=1 Tax=unclassified Bradyrhizobium TaxID=2631580 RepID=UPI001FFA33F3|nr:MULTISPECIES: hypothetical protein [unclassified Bradyrhizobium]MCK1400027.1 hypothetical protein [Bradyrhizobium sp. 39]MCK1750317.1 hypothetical protein [Bradyrhizobium sp. 135]UPJ31932.1 hypothetical protein IVB45_18070 [Bradyrhizobium sp. 4]